MFDTEDAELKDNENQTSRYIPGSLKKKSDNINQTVRYILRSENPIPTPPELSEEDPPSDHPSEPPSEPPSPGKKSKPGGGWKWWDTPESTPEPTPIHTPKPTPPQSEQEEGGDLEEQDEYLENYGFMAWFARFVAPNGHEEPPPVEEAEEEEELIPIEAPPMELPLPTPEEEQNIPMDGVMDIPADEEGLEALWYNSRNKNKRKKK